MLIIQVGAPYSGRGIAGHHLRLVPDLVAAHGSDFRVS
jgi:hypothetical protein